MKAEHTPEPWRIGAMESGMSAIDGHDGSEVTGFINPEDARRILACVNACAGMTNEQIDNVCMISGSLRNRFGEQMAYLGQVEKQRDELLAALEQFATWGRMQHKAQSKGCHATFDMMSLKDEIDLAEAAIASVKEN